MFPFHDVIMPDQNISEHPRENKGCNHLFMPWSHLKHVSVSTTWLLICVIWLHGAQFVVTTYKQVSFHHVHIGIINEYVAPLHVEPGGVSFHLESYSTYRSSLGKFCSHCRFFKFISLNIIQDSLNEIFATLFIISSWCFILVTIWLGQDCHNTRRYIS